MSFVNFVRNELLFGKVAPQIKLGKTRPLSADEMPALHRRFNPMTVGNRFDAIDTRSGAALLRGILVTMRREITVMAVVSGLSHAMNLVGPLLIYQLVQYVAAAADGKAHVGLGALVALTLCVTSVGQATLLQHYFYLALGHMQTIVNGMNKRIYAKALRLSRYTQQKRPTGDVVNLMGTDSDAVAEFVFAGTDLFFAGVTILVVTGLLFHFLGIAAFAGVVVLACIAPLTKRLVSRFTHLDTELMKHRDERVSLVSQVLSGIRIVKYFAWTGQIFREISAIRDQEVLARKRIANSSCISLMVYFAGSTLVGVVAFGTYLWMGNQLDAATVFSCIALFGMLDGPFGNLTEYIANIAAARVSSSRIAEFLADEEAQESHRSCYEGLQEGVSPPDVALAVKLNKLEVRYRSDASTMTEKVIHGVDIAINAGESVAIVGPVGSGKSTLLLAMLGEVPITAGAVEYKSGNDVILDGVQPRTAFVPQEAFIMNGTLRENIIFGDERANPDVEVALNDAVFAAVLDQDLRGIRGGLDAEIGEHGINLSGGQKQRVSLARAVMARPGVVLLDDPLSAVDHATEANLVTRLLFGEWAKITRIVVTHRLAHLERFDRVVFLENGQIVAQGRFSEVLRSSERFKRFYAEVSAKEHTREGLSVTESSSLGKSQDKNAIEALPVVSELASQSGSVRITDDEDRESGTVNSRVYWNYIRALGGSTMRSRRIYLPLLLLATIAVAVLPVLQSAWLAVWTNNLKVATDDAHLVRDLRYLAVYGGIGFAVLIAYVGQHLLWMYRAIAAGRELHDRAMSAVLHTTLRFFDATPIGRILNRFSRDVDSCERELMWSFEQTIRSGSYTLMSIVVLVVLMPVVVIVIVPMLFLYGRVQASYRAVSREAQRLTSVARSPRFAHFKETLQGLTVIRAFRRQEVFAAKYATVLTDYQKMFHSLVIFNRWFSIRIPLLGALVSLAVTFGIVWLGRSGALLAGTSGLALMYSLRFWESLNWSVRSFSQVEAKMTSVERLDKFASLPPEREVTVEPAIAEHAVWPVAGQVEFEYVSARYANHLPDVLRGVDFLVPPGAKVGFVGRTGAGKSTVFQVLFRFINPSAGRVLIDGVDTGRIPIERLRRAIAIIPQDPTLFRGTLRSNLDRFGVHNEEAIWAALRRAHLESFVRELKGQLDAEVRENGHNFSQGQRQLFCLARALLLDARIIVLDEATASVDVETDQLIQQTIREECADKTLLIIAHRLETLRDCDFVIEIDQGKSRRLVADNEKAKEVGKRKSEELGVRV